MKLRIASLSFLLSVLSCGLAWLSLQPLLLRLFDSLRGLAPPGSASLQTLARLQELLPLVLCLNIAVLTLLGYGILDFMVGRPLRRVERSVEGLGRLELEEPLERGGGPLLSRIQGALARMVDALQAERKVTQEQLLALRASHARLARAQTELVVAERLATVGKLAAGVAHEVGNPLSGVLGYLSLARSRASDAGAVQEYLARIEEEVLRVDGIVRKLLDLGRAAPEVLEPVDMAEAIRSCTQLVAAGAEFRGIDLALDLQPCVARAAKGPLSQILINLLINAAQALGGRGRVVLRLSARGRAVVVDVEDDGPGLPDDVLAHLFEPFFTTRAAGAGTGLGLAVSLHLAAAMHGQLVAENRSEGGARFRLTLPAA